jgi:hypothetical protein
MAFPTTSILDDFNRADENPLSGGGNWAGPIFSANSQMQLVSQAVTGAVAATGDGSYWNASQFNNGAVGVEVFADVGTVNGTDRFFLDWVENPNTGVENGYELQVNLSVDLWRLRRLDASVATTLGANVTQAVTAGDGIGFSSVNGTHTVYYRAGAGSWTVLFSRSDNTYVGNGNIGLGTIGTVNTMDNFGGGAVADDLVELEASRQTYEQPVYQ